MLIETISFRIFNNSFKTDEEYLIENTIENQEKVFSNRHTHGIEFTRTFDFQFEKTERVALSFVEFDDELDSIDEMVGSF